MNHKVTAQFIQDCSSDSSLLRAYAKRSQRNPELKRAGIKIKKAIAENGNQGYYEFSVKNLNSHFFTVERFTHDKELYAVVTNSAINYIFKILQ